MPLTMFNFLKYYLILSKYHENKILLKKLLFSLVGNQKTNKVKRKIK